MKLIILLMLATLPIIGFSQSTHTFIKLTDARNQLIKGSSVTKGFEGWILAETTSSTGKNNTLLSFTMNVSGASADLKKAMASGELLKSGQVNVMTPGIDGGAPKPAYIIKMELIKVLACAETTGTNGATITSVSLQATRIGWTYYQTSRTGTLSVSRKYGWDDAAKGEWLNF